MKIEEEINSSPGIISPLEHFLCNFVVSVENLKLHRKTLSMLSMMEVNPGHIWVESRGDYTDERMTHERNTKIYTNSLPP